MKKLIIISIVFMMVAMFTVSTVKAVSGATIVNDIYNLGKKYGFTESDKLRADRYVADNPITDEQATAIYAKAEEAIKYLEETDAKNVKKLDTQLTKEQKLKFENLCQEAASIVGVTLTYNNGNVDVYKNGKKIDTYTFTDGKLPYTGNNINVILVVSSVAVIALATFAIVRKKKTVNA